MARHFFADSDEEDETNVRRVSIWSYHAGIEG